MSTKTAPDTAKNCRSLGNVNKLNRNSEEQGTNNGLFISKHIYESKGTAVAQWLRCCDTNRKFAGSIPASVSGFYIDIKSFRSHYGPGGRLSL